MKPVSFIISIFLLFQSCNSSSIQSTGVSEEVNNTSFDLVIAFGSCNRQNLKNALWDDVLKNNPSYWIWGGDNIYASDGDLESIKEGYQKQLANPEYKALVDKVEIHGTWDDHEYGLNDGGVEFERKVESQTLLLDFLGVATNDERRNRKGVYYAYDILLDKGKVKLVVLDTRYFRTGLTESTNPDLRYDPNPYGEGTMLGEEQWRWLETELRSTDADFNLIVSSIQFLSGEHGYESWANMPHEQKKLMEIIQNSKPKGVIFLSGDRHISEFSILELESVAHPLIDFTSSGLTHSWNTLESEPNKHRVGELITAKSFGLLKFDFDNKKVTMQMRGDNNVLQQELIQDY